MSRPAAKLRLPLALFVLAALAGGPRPAGGAPDKIDPELYASLGAGGETAYYVRLRGRADFTAARTIPDRDARGAAVLQGLTSVARASQASLVATLAARGIPHRSFYIVNAVRVVGDLALARELAARDDVESVLPERVYAIPEPSPGKLVAAQGTVEWNVARVGAERVWTEFGVTGEGIVVGLIDTGVDFGHEALTRSYRGNLGGGAFAHDYSWWYPPGGCPAPCDEDGHGTHTTGTVVGGDGPGPLANDVGVAPGARWIAAGCGFFGTTECLLSAGQFMLAPTARDGSNPDPSRRPHVVSNSWGLFGDDTFYAAVVDAWLAAGIFPVFAAGNEGPGCGTLRSPGDYPGSFTVGATDFFDQIASFSSRGPSPFGGFAKPDLTAPGVDVRSSVPGGYAVLSGTSMATPHVAGIVALLWSADPSLARDVEATRALLASTAIDVPDLACGGDADGDPNNTYGEGRVDALAACEVTCGDPARLTGFVRGAGGGGPIAGAEVKAVRRGDGLVLRTTSAGDGSYAIRLPVTLDGAAQTYDVAYTAFGYASRQLTMQAVQGARLHQNVRLTSLPRFVVSGVVRDARDSSPIAGATVTLHGTPLAPQQSDASGAFAFAGVPAGRYRLEGAAGVCKRPRTRLVVVDAADRAMDLRLRALADDFGHECREEAFAWVDAPEPVPYAYPAPRLVLPFRFYFYGQHRAAIYPGSNGFVGFWPRYPIYYFNEAIPTPLEPNDVLYPFWDDLITGSWAIATLGEPPDRTYVLEYVDFATFPGGSPVRFEVLLHERDSSITFQYLTAEDGADGRSATIGIEGPGGTDALQIGHEQPIVRPGFAVRFVPPVIDTDQDGVPEQIDLCPAVADPDQRDRDGDGLGNACDDLDGTLRPTQLQIRRSTSEQHANGRVLLEAELLQQGPGDSVAVPDGLTLHLSDSLQLDRVVEWTGEECRVTSRGVTRCRRKEAPRHVAELTPLPSDIEGLRVYWLKVRLVQLDLDAPFLSPLRVTLTNDPRAPGRGIDRIGTPTDCAARTYGLECEDGREGSASRAFLLPPPETIFD
ncbi:MAG: S8 family serine peptidase [Thermodesulfobacteriota bacterium]